MMSVYEQEDVPSEVCSSTSETVSSNAIGLDRINAVAKIFCLSPLKKTT